MYGDYLNHKEDPFPHIKEGRVKNQMEYINRTLGKLEAEEFEIREKLNLNLAAQESLRQALKWGDEVYKADERLDRDLENSKKATAGMLTLLLSDESKEFFDDLQRGRDMREKPTAGLS